MIRRWWDFFPPPHTHREFVWGLGLLRVAGLGYGNQARQQLEVGLAISGTNSKMSVVRMCRNLGLGFYISDWGFGDDEVMWQGFQRGFTSDADCHATSFNECGPHAKTHVCYKQLNGVARFVPFWFIMYGFAPSKLRVPKLSILEITVAIFAPLPLRYLHIFAQSIIPFPPPLDIIYMF